MIGWIIKLILTSLLFSPALVLPLRWVDPPTTSFMLRDALHHSRPVQHWWLALSDISVNLPIAVVAAEDQKFPFHHGFDFEQIRRVLSQEGSPQRGASTLSQQLAKNLYLWPGKSYFRKALEAWFTVWLELLLSKQRLLELYLNVAEFAPGVYGAGAGSQLLLGVRASDLSPAQAATLAAVLPNPAGLSVTMPSAYVRQRSAAIQQEVEQLGGPAWLSK